MYSSYAEVHIAVINVKSENHAKEIVGMMIKDECESSGSNGRFNLGFLQAF